MKITPIDVSHRTFTRRMFGYDDNEVTEFLTAVAAQMEALIHERNVLKEALREKEIQIGEYKERDQLLKSTITTAAQMADKMKIDAEREARLVIADAQQKAEFITRDSRDSLKKVYAEITELKKARLQFEANLKALAQAHMTLLEQGEKYMPMIGLAGHDMANASADANRSSEISPVAAR